MSKYIPLSSHLKLTLMWGQLPSCSTPLHMIMSLFSLSCPWSFCQVTAQIRSWFIFTVSNFILKKHAKTKLNQNNILFLKWKCVLWYNRKAKKIFRNKLNRKSDDLNRKKYINELQAWIWPWTVVFPGMLSVSSSSESGIYLSDCCEHRAHACYSLSRMRCRAPISQSPALLLTEHSPVINTIHSSMYYHILNQSISSALW